MGKKPAKNYVYFIRILAAFLVVYNHSAAYSYYMHHDGILRYVYMFGTMVTRINVPLFFMVTGLLLLDRKEDILYVLKHRLPRYLILIFILACVYVAKLELPEVLKTQSLFSSALFFGKHVFAYFISGGYVNWFLHAYVGILLMLPYLQRVAAGFTRQDFCVLLVLHALCTTVLPMISMISPLAFPSYLSIPLASEKALFYVLAGYYLDKHVQIETLKPRTFLILGGLSVLGIVISCLCTTWQGLTTGIFTEDYVQLFDYVTTIFAFLLIKYVVTVCLPQREYPMVALLAGLTFGVYLLDGFLKELVGDFYFQLAAGLPVFFSSVGWCLVSMILCGGITYVLKKLPGFRKLL